MVEVFMSKLAVAKAKELVNQTPSYQGLALRLYIEGKGCDGFFYGITFDEASSEDLHFPHDGVDVIVDPDAIEFLVGAKIDWIDDERGKGFLVDNPEHRRYRGKFFKKSAWQKHFIDKMKGTQHG